MSLNGAGSRLRPDTVRAMTSVRSRTDRVRARATEAAAAGIGVALMMAGAMATIQDDVLIGTRTWTDRSGRSVSQDMFEASGGLSPFLSEPGLRPGVVAAAVLLVLPFLALAVQALRVGRVVEDRRSRRLVFAGATRADLRRLRTARTSAAFVRGGLIAGPAYLVLWVVLGFALPVGSRLLPPLHGAMALVWLAAVGVLWVVARVLSVLGSQDPQDPQDPRDPQDRVPSRSFVVGTALGGGVLLVGGPAVGADDWVFAVVLVVALVLFLLAAGAGAARSAAGSVRGASFGGRGRPGWFARRDTAVGLLADAQRRGSTVAVTGAAGVLFVCGLSFGVEAALSAQVLVERLGVAGYDPNDITFYVGGAALAGAVGLVGALVAVAALLLSLTDHLLGNRRAVASVAALGVEPRRLVRVQAISLVRTAVPATVAGVLVSAVPFSLTLFVPTGWSPFALLPLAVVVVVAVLMTGACHLLALALAGRVRSASALENLRVP